MQRRKFTRKLKLEAVKLRQERVVTVAQAARDLGVTWHGVAPMGAVACRRCAAGLSGQGQLKPEQAELARLRREVIKLTSCREIR